MTTETEQKSKIRINLLERNTEWISHGEQASKKAIQEEYRKRGYNLNQRQFNRADAERAVKMIESFNSIHPAEDVHGAHDTILGIFGEWFGITKDDIVEDGRIHVGYFKTFLQEKC